MNNATMIPGLGMYFLRPLARVLATASMAVLVSISHAADPLGLFPGVAENKILGAIANPSAFNTTIANSDINYYMNLGTWTYNVRLPSGYDPGNPSKQYGLVTWIDAGGGNVFPSSYAAALDAHDVIWISGHANHLTFTFNRIADPMLVYQVEAGSDLAASTWSSIWQSTGVQNTVGSVTVTDTAHDVGSSNPPRRFLRLRIETP